MKSIKLNVFFILLFSLFIQNTFNVLLAQSGSLDPTFGSGGIVITSMSTSQDWINDIVIQNDGKIVAAGSVGAANGNDVALARYNTDGSLDATFGNGGKVSSDFGNQNNEGLSVALQSDGKIVVAGQTTVNTVTIFGSNTVDNFAVFRYNSDGTLDNTFGNGGQVLGKAGNESAQYFNSVGIQSDGKIVASGHCIVTGGNSAFLVVRFNTDGTLDNTFGNGGKVTENFGGLGCISYALAIQIDGKIVLGGYISDNNLKYAMARYNTDGTLDNTFGSGGKVVSVIGNQYDIINDIAIQADGKILAAGHVDSNGTCNAGITRYNTNGTFDTSFGTGGSTITSVGKSTSEATSVAIQSNGKIVISCRAYNDSVGIFAVVRYNTDGILDTLFTSGNYIQTQIGKNYSYSATVAIQSDDKIVAAGYTTNYDENNNNDFALARYLTGCTTPTLTINSPLSICAGESIILSASGADTYSWSDGIVNGESFVPTLGVHTYTVIGSTNDGCSDTVTTTVTVNELPYISADATASAVCKGASVTLSGTSTSANTPINYSWSDGIIDAVSFIPSMSNIYTVTGTDANGCGDTSTINITVNELPEINANASSMEICKGDSVILSGVSTALNVQINYVWSDGIIDSVAFKPSSTQIYTVIGTDENSCSDTATIEVSVNDLPVISATTSATTLCRGASVVLSGESASDNVTFAWSDGVSNGISFTPSVTNTYTVTGTDTNTCSNSDTITVMVYETSASSITVSASAYNLCSGDSTTFTASGADSYSWSHGVNNDVSFIPASSDTYTLTATDSNGCVLTETLNIVVNSLPVVEAIATAEKICLGLPVTLNGSGANTYNWSDGVTDAVAFTPTSTKNYTVTGTDTNNCVNTDTITIYVKTEPITVSTNASATILCASSPLTLTGSTASNAEQMTYTWSHGVINDEEFNPNTTQTYTLTGADEYGCEDSDTITVVTKAQPDVFAHASEEEICEGDSIYLSKTGNAISYAWANKMKDSLNFAPTTTQSYTLTGFGSNGCSKTDTVLVNVYDVPLVGVSGYASRTLICSGDSVVLSGSGADYYYWSSRVKDRVAFYPMSTKTYTLTGITKHTCDNSTTITIEVNKSPEVHITSKPTSSAVCYGDPIILYGDSDTATTFHWSDGVEDGVSFVPETSHTYTLVVEDTNNCIGRAIHAVSVFPLPNVSIDVYPADSICIGDSILLHASGAKTFTWYNDVKDSIYFYPNTTTIYKVMGKDEYSCSSTVEQRIAVDSCKVDENPEDNPNPQVGIEELTASKTINIYPNPNNGNFTISGAEEGIYKLVNELGQLMEELNLNSNNNYSTEIKNLSSGIYFIIGVNENTSVSEKIVVIR